MQHYLEYLHEDFTAQAAKLRARAELIDQTLSNLKDIDINKALYIVYLHSMWDDEGEVDTRTEHFGTVQDALKKAEIEFKAKNNRNDVQADYSVKVVIGAFECYIPSKYWKG